jgi:hypothetical protein
MKLKHKFASLLLFTAVSCASGATYSEIEHRIPEIPTGEGRIIFYRDASMFGAAVQPAVSLDEQEVGESVPGGFFFVDRPAGKFRANCSTEVDRQVSFTLAEQQVRYIRGTVSMGFWAGHVNLEMVDPNEAKPGLGDLSYTGLNDLLKPETE